MVRSPRLTRVSDGKLLRRLLIGSKGRLLAGVFAGGYRLCLLSGWVGAGGGSRTPMGGSPPASEAGASDLVSPRPRAAPPPESCWVAARPLFVGFVLCGSERSAGEV